MPVRTANSPVRGCPAREVTPQTPRFVWTRAEERDFRAHIKAHPREDNRYDDLEPLLAALDLDGFTPDIVGANGQRIHDMIIFKVKRKLCRMRHAEGLGAGPASLQAVAQLRPRILQPAAPQPSEGAGDMAPAAADGNEGYNMGEMGTDNADPFADLNAFDFNIDPEYYKPGDNSIYLEYDEDADFDFEAYIDFDTGHGPNAAANSQPGSLDPRSLSQPPGDATFFDNSGGIKFDRDGENP